VCSKRTTVGELAGLWEGVLVIQDFNQLQLSDWFCSRFDFSRISKSVE
jgi:hypothetical protein